MHLFARVADGALVANDPGRIQRGDACGKRPAGAEQPEHCVRSARLGAHAVVAWSTPPPYSGSSFRSTVLDPSDSGLVGLFTQAGMLPRDVNTDGTAAQNVRVYQRANGLTMQVPLYFRSGPLVTLSYQVGVVYSTRCGVYDGGCSTGPSGVPGASPALTAANALNWAPADPDYGAQVFSTLQLQRSMLQTTVTNLDLIRDNFQNYYRESERLASATDTTNWYPAPSSSLAGQNPLVNQGCYCLLYTSPSPRDS